MRIIIALTVFAYLFSAELKAQTSYEGWNGVSETRCVQTLVESLLKKEIARPSHPQPRDLAQRALTVVAGPIGHNSYDAHGTIMVGARPSAQPCQENFRFNQVVAHEFQHWLVDFSGDDFLPETLREALAEYYAREIANDEESQGARFTSARSRMRLSPAFQISPLPPELSVNNTIWQTDSLHSCINGECGSWGRSWDQLAFQIHEFVSAVSGQTGQTKRQVFLEMTGILYDLSRDRIESYGKIQQAVFWKKLGEVYPSVQVNGMSPAIFFGTRRTFMPLKEGKVFSIATQGAMGEPVNPGLWIAKARTVRPKQFLDVPAESSPLKTQVTITVSDWTDRQIYESSAQPDSQGMAFGQLPTFSQPGIYRVALLAQGIEQAHNFFMVVPYTMLNPYPEGIFIWNIDKEGRIRSTHIIPEGCESKFTANALSLIECPSATRSIIVEGRSFQLYKDMRQIIMPNAGMTWPVVELEIQGAIILSDKHPTQDLSFRNINPSAEEFEWVIRVVHSPEMIDQAWLTAKGTGNNTVTLTAKPDGLKWKLREGLVCVEAVDGPNINCVEVLYPPKED